MLQPVIVSIGKRHVCRCRERCRLAVEFRDVSGELERTLCANDARKLVADTIDALLHAPALPEIRQLQTWTPKEERTLAQLLQEGKTQGQIGLALGRTTPVVRKKIAHMRKVGKLPPR